LPPVQQGREFNSLDTTGNSEPQEQTVKVGFHSSTSHLELAGNLGVIASLQQQFYDLLFARTEPDSLLLHSSLPVFFLILPVANQAYSQLSKSSSTHIATSSIFCLL
jgi:hypothetical protein